MCLVSLSWILLVETHSDVGVNLLLKAPYLGKVLPDCFLEVQDAAALLLGVAWNLQLETHALLLLTVLLRNEWNNIYFSYNFPPDIPKSLLKKETQNHLSSGLHVEQEVVDDVQNHSVLIGVGGYLQIVVNEGKSVHCACFDENKNDLKSGRQDVKNESILN